MAGGAGGEVVLYESPDGEVRLDVRLERESVWLTQAQMSELFGRERSVITKHIRNVFREGELAEKGNVQDLHIASSDRPVAFYNLDVIISVGYRVKSQRGTQFRIWATRTLKGHLVRGYTLNERRLREKGFGEIEQAVGLQARTLSAHERIRLHASGSTAVIPAKAGIQCLSVA
ncbi:MAG: virulence RhuM family protein [Betaproteobacteria bacterium]|nr:virulence RhuM family protein [Betaproteobacteria bacterium]